MSGKPLGRRWHGQRPARVLRGSWEDRTSLQWPKLANRKRRPLPYKPEFGPNGPA
jgi:hypothetical protein